MIVVDGDVGEGCSCSVDVIGGGVALAVLWAW
jgi:hypothetical protein